MAIVGWAPGITTTKVGRYATAMAERGLIDAGVAIVPHHAHYPVAKTLLARLWPTEQPTSPTAEAPA